MKLNSEQLTGSKAGEGFYPSVSLFDVKNNTPLCNVLVSVAQTMGLEMDKFGSSTASGVRGLERA